MTNKEKSHDFSCDNCGRKITAYPPDGMYTKFYVNRCCEKSLERSYECDNCDQKNIRFWCYFHRVFAASSYKTHNALFR